MLIQKANTTCKAKGEGNTADPSLALWHFKDQADREWKPDPNTIATARTSESPKLIDVMDYY